jgi:hypothetical protein
LTRDSRRHGDSRRCCARSSRRRSGRGRRHGNFGRNYNNRRRTVSRSHRSRRHHPRRRRSGRFTHRLRWHFFRRSFCPGLDRRRRLDGRTRSGGLNHCLLLDGAQHVARPRDMRKIDLGLNFFFAVSGARRGPRRTGRYIGAAAEMFPHQFRFVVLE